VAPGPLTRSTPARPRDAPRPQPPPADLTGAATSLPTASSARAYEEYFVPAMFAPLSRHSLAAAALQPGEHVLDLACGTGIVARQAAELVGPKGRVLAVDVSAAMLEEARTHGADRGAEVAWRQADVVAADLPVGHRRHPRPGGAPPAG
jgi:SAM-dependent methyltransferase